MKKEKISNSINYLSISIYPYFCKKKHRKKTSENNGNCTYRDKWEYSQQDRNEKESYLSIPSYMGLIFVGHSIRKLALTL